MEPPPAWRAYDEARAASQEPFGGGCGETSPTEPAWHTSPIQIASLFDCVLHLKPTKEPVTARHRPPPPAFCVSAWGLTTNLWIVISSRCTVSLLSFEASVAAIQADLLAHGPSQASMYLTDEFEVYAGGVFTTRSTDYIGAHAVKIVGWGVDDGGVAYWTVQNSWNDECAFVVVVRVAVSPSSHRARDMHFTAETLAASSACRSFREVDATDGQFLVRRNSPNHPPMQGARRATSGSSAASTASRSRAASSPGRPTRGESRPSPASRVRAAHSLALHSPSTFGCQR